MPRLKEEIERDFEKLLSTARARREAAQDPSIKGLRTAETDWMTSDEMNELSCLQAEWSLTEPTLSELRERVQQKRAARLRERLIHV